MATLSTEPPGLLADRSLYRLSLDLYHRMGEIGLLAPDDRVVLLDGLLVKKMTKRPHHSTASRRGMKCLEAVIPRGWHVRIEQPISLTGGPEGADSEPEPDLAIVRGGDEMYIERHPAPAEIALLVEIADSSLAHDRAGLARYAWAGIPCVWIVNLMARTIEVYSGPSGPAINPTYAQRSDHGLGEALTIVINGTHQGRAAVRDFLA